MLGLALILNLPALWVVLQGTFSVKFNFFQNSCHTQLDFPEILYLHAMEMPYALCSSSFPLPSLKGKREDESVTTCDCDTGGS